MPRQLEKCAQKINYTFSEYIFLRYAPVIWYFPLNNTDFAEFWEYCTSCKADISPK